MSVLLSTPATVSVTSFPYSLPAAGQALLIGNNYAENVRPSTHSAFEWNYALFFFYGGGTFVEDYSAGGAYVIAGSGGHAAVPLIPWRCSHNSSNPSCQSSLPRSGVRRPFGSASRWSTASGRNSPRSLATGA